MPLITFEGTEGCGKSTQARRLAELLGPQTLLTHEPGGTEIGQEIRRILLDRRNSRLQPIAELLLYYADRAQHVGERLRPALAEGRFVISDRYADSSIAYQGYGRELSLELIVAITEAATGGLKPDLTLLLDLPVEVGLSRVGQRGGGRDRLEVEGVAFHARVREGYLALVRQDPERWVRLDGDATPDAVAERVRDAVAARGWLRR
jgi:dTMP kinase